MVDPGEEVSATLRREFTEEAGNVPEEERARFNEMVEELFAHGDELYRGYMDDPRNTDNSWMETVAMHFHCGEDVAKHLSLHHGDDAAAVQWMPMSLEDDLDPSTVHKGHLPLIKSALENVRAKLSESKP